MRTDSRYGHHSKIGLFEIEMRTQIGPVLTSRIILCSADAHPDSQRGEQKSAEYFFPGGRWVGAMRNASHNLGCRFVILTTGYGLVNPDDLLEKYDKHIDKYRSFVAELWGQTVPRVLGAHQYDMMVFYAGGCPREKYLEVLWPLMLSAGISLITFGQPNMCDAGKIERFVKMIVRGTSLDELRDILKYPERLEYYPALPTSGVSG